MVTEKPKPKFTWEDYANTSEGERWGLVDGELMLAPSPKEAQQRSQIRVGYRMNTYSEDRDLGRVYIEFDVVLSDADTVRPDLIFGSKERLHIITEDNVQDAPDRAVEIRSESTARQDWTIKRELHDRHGVKENWLADPEAATVSALLLDDGKLKVAGVYGESNTLTSTVLEGFTTALGDVFRG